MYGYFHAYQVDIVDLANYLEAKGRTNAVKRWEQVKKNFTDNGYIFRQGFYFGLQDSDVEDFIEEDCEFQGDIDFIKNEFNLKDNAILLCRIPSERVLERGILKIENYVLKPKMEKCHIINFLEMCERIQYFKKELGVLERWKQVVKWQSMNYSNYSYFDFVYSCDELCEGNMEFFLDCKLLETLIEKEKNIKLEENDKIVFHITW